MYRAPRKKNPAKKCLQKEKEEEKKDKTKRRKLNGT